MSEEKTRILVVDDEEQLLSLISYALTTAGMEVRQAQNGAQALAAIRDEAIDFVVLDVLLPDANGIDLCRQLRRHTDAPVIFLTVRSDQADVIAGLEAGGDDYLAKPFSVDELILRINAILRRASPATQELTVGDLSLSQESLEVTVATGPVDLTPLEFKFLWYLAVNRNRIVPAAELVEEVWGVADLGGHDPMIKSAVYRIRQKLANPIPPTVEIRNVRGVGYQLRPVESGAPEPLTP